MLERDPLFLARANTGQGHVARAKPLSSLLIHHDRPSPESGHFAESFGEMLLWILDLRRVRQPQLLCRDFTLLNRCICDEIVRQPPDEPYVLGKTVLARSERVAEIVIFTQPAPEWPFRLSGRFEARFFLLGFLRERLPDRYVGSRTVTEVPYVLCYDPRDRLPNFPMLFYCPLVVVRRHRI
jgi:hypothetical protein